MIIGIEPPPLWIQRAWPLRMRRGAIVTRSVPSQVRLTRALVRVGARPPTWSDFHYVRVCDHALLQPARSLARARHVGPCV